MTVCFGGSLPLLTQAMRRCDKKCLIAPVCFSHRGQNPSRHSRSPRVYTYKDNEYLLKK